MRNTRGLTLIEMLVALVLFTIVLAGALGALRSQSRGFDRGSDDLSALQNMRFAADLLQQELQTAGTNLAANQAPLIYAGADAVAFNADYVSNVANDPFAAYVDPDAPPGQVTGLTLANQIPIPGSSPAFSYPLADYTNNFAETITFFFQLDGSTTDPNDYVLRRQVNNQPSEILVRNILPFPGRTFFRYQYKRDVGGVGMLDTVPTAWVPMSHTAAVYTGTESGVIGRINSLRAVEVSYTISNGRTGADRRLQQMSFIVPLPNMGITQVRTCGAAPILGIPLVAATAGVPGAPQIDLTWPAALDETGGERDVLRYVIWRKRTVDPTWGDPYRSIPSGNLNYLFSDVNVVSGETWQYQIAAQDCTPSVSAVALSAAITVP